MSKAIGGDRKVARIKKEKIETASIPPVESFEARENQLISLAMDRAEKQIREGTVSSQVLTHFLKLGTEKASLENEKIKNENEMLKAKVETLRSQQRSEELYQQALNAMRSYAGLDDFEEDYSDEDD